MSIAEEISRIKRNIGDAYSEAYIKGASSPLVENSDNLASTIATITGGGGSGAEYEQGTITPTEDTQNPTITFANTHTVAPSVFIIQETSEVPTDVNGVYYLLFVDYEHLTNYYIRNQGPTYQSSTYSYIITSFQKSATQTSSVSMNFTYSYTDTHDNASRYPRYFIKETGATPRTDWSSGNPDITYIANHTYKWYAIWK